MFGKGPSHAKAGVNPFSGNKQKNHRVNINDSPFATKSKGKKKRKPLPKKGKASNKPKFSNKKPKKSKVKR